MMRLCFPCMFFALAGAISNTKQRFELVVPRVTASELLQNQTLLSGHWPYVLVGEADKWPALRRWSPERLVRRISQEWVDYYPNNMLNVGNKPYLLRYEDAVRKFLEPSTHSRYMQLRLSLEGWTELERDLGRLPEVFYTEAEWMPKCMTTADGSLDAEAVDNFYRVNQWNFLLIGEKGTGIFFHNDHLSAASWQAAIKGRKRWILCPYDQREYLSVELDPFNPDYSRFSGFAQAYCADVVVQPGEIVYYPAYWWHATRNLDTPTIGLTGLMVGNEDDRLDLQFAKVHEQFAADLRSKCSSCWDLSRGRDQPRKCDDISERWPGAAPPISYDVCTKYLTRCEKLWGDKAERDRSLAESAVRKDKCPSGTRTVNNRCELEPEESSTNNDTQVGSEGRRRRRDPERARYRKQEMARRNRISRID